jgi:hypothetical protein
MATGSAGSIPASAFAQSTMYAHRRSESWYAAQPSG